MTRTTPFGRVLADLAAAEPQRPAVTCGASTLSRQELDQRSNALAHALHSRGVGRGDYVAIVLDNSPDYLVAAFAAWKVGAVPQPLAATMPPAEVDAVLALVGPALVIGGAQSRYPSIPVQTAVVDDTPLPAVVSPSWKALTSGGSTGAPKVIVDASPAVAEAVTPFARLVDMPDQGTVMAPGPLRHNGPFMAATVALLTGCHVVLQPRFDAESLLADIQRHRVQWLYAVPTMMQRIWRLPEPVRTGYDLSSLRRVTHMAAPCPAWLKRAWIGWLGPERVVEVYAATEGMAATRIDGTEWLRRPGSVGRAAVGEIQILDAAGTAARPGRVGQVWLRRDQNEPEPYRYIGAEARRRPGGWVCVGDLGYLDEDGYLFLTDRESDMILVGGANVYPAEIEAVLDEHPAVLTSCVVGIPHEDLGSVPHAIVQCREPVEAEDLLAFLRTRISAYRLPRSIEFSTEPLRDDAGKVRRSALRAERIAQLGAH